ncbi:MAG TPA: hypothetical protein VLX59_07175, partial [Acidimicrobiales bacterium]|nr:hypothetical protein [Acidimicrobiales bacterium]
PANPRAAAVITVIVEPLVTWIWVGGAVMLCGCALSAWPVQRRRRRGSVVGVETGEPDGALVADSVGSAV